MSKTAPFFLFLFVIAILLPGCFEPYDPELEVPDTGGHGYSLTPLGCMVGGPWEVDEFIGGSNVRVYSRGKQIASYAKDYTNAEKDLVFELMKDGTMHFWFKRDYINSEAKSDPTDSNIIRTEVNKPENLHIKKIYDSGKWQAEYKDSIISIHFGDTVVSPNEFKGKYSELGSSNLAIQRSYSFDTTINGVKEGCKKIITTRYSHPWYHQF